MEIQLEEIKPEHNSSFRWLIDPKLNDFFFWHFHPEYELVYIQAPQGTKHVGDHISRFLGSELVLIGSNIPHLNFDYGIREDYHKIVLHISPQFLLETLSQTPELEAIGQLLERAKHGISFGENTKNQWGKVLRQLPIEPAFDQFLGVLALLNGLALAKDVELLHPKPVENRFNQREQARLKRLYRFIDENYQRKIEVEEVAQLCHFTKAAFCRYFKKMTKLTFTDFLNTYRISQAKRVLLTDKNVTETCFECGFESLSYFNRTFKKITNETPLSFKKRFVGKEG